MNNEQTNRYQKLISKLQKLSESFFELKTSCDDCRDAFDAFTETTDATEGMLLQIILGDIEDYEKRKTEFYSNPLHWGNNKRKRAGLPTLRGKLNKCRSKVYPSFRLSANIYRLIEKYMTENLLMQYTNPDFFKSFVSYDAKCLGSNEYYVSDWRGLL